MRCFFHLLNGDDTILDDQGLEIADLHEAEVQALMAIQEVRQEMDSIDEDLKGWISTWRMGQEPLSCPFLWMR